MPGPRHPARKKAKVEVKVKAKKMVVLFFIIFFPFEFAGGRSSLFRLLKYPIHLR
jgi:hypothetical protein